VVLVFILRDVAKVIYEIIEENMSESLRTFQIDLMQQMKNAEGY
jgi:hypothetical protein